MGQKVKDIPDFMPIDASMTPGIGPYRICYDCKHLLDGVIMRCKAYPDGIPDDLLDELMAEGGHDHNLPGDNGVHFQKRNLTV